MKIARFIGSDSLIGVAHLIGGLHGMPPIARQVINIPSTLVAKIDRFSELESKRVPGLKLSRSVAACVLIMEGLKAKLDASLLQAISAEENGAPDGEEMRREIEAACAELLGDKC